MSSRTAGQFGPGFYAALAYIATTAICVWLLKHALADADPWLRTLVGLLPLLPIAWLVQSVVRKMLDGDELQRRIHLEAIAVSSVLVGLGSLTLNLLMIAGAIELGGRQAMSWVFPALVLGYGAARIWATRRYR